MGIKLVDKQIAVEGVNITVSVEQLSLHPLSYKITAAVDGQTHEQTITMTNTGSDVTRVPTLAEAQKYLDDARQDTATKCHKKYLTSSLAASLK